MSLSYMFLPLINTDFYIPPKEFGWAFISWKSGQVVVKDAQ